MFQVEGMARAKAVKLEECFDSSVAEVPKRRMVGDGRLYDIRVIFLKHTSSPTFSNSLLPKKVNKVHSP